MSELLLPCDCNHNDCDCLACLACGAHAPEGTPDWEVLRESFQIGEDWEEEVTGHLCPVCSAAKEAADAAQRAAWRAAREAAADDGEDIPF
jgi:hypothetical protein